MSGGIQPGGLIILPSSRRVSSPFGPILSKLLRTTSAHTALNGIPNPFIKASTVHTTSAPSLARCEPRGVLVETVSRPLNVRAFDLFHAERALRTHQEPPGSAIWFFTINW